MACNRKNCREKTGKGVCGARGGSKSSSARPSVSDHSLRTSALVKMKYADKFETESEFTGSSGVIKLVDESGDWVSQLEYSLENDGKTLSIDDLQTDTYHQKKGLSEYLYRKALDKHPEVTSINSRLVAKNYDVLRDYLQNEYGVSVEEADEEQLMYAVAETPAYRTRCKIGFGALLSIDVRNRDQVFVKTYKD